MAVAHHCFATTILPGKAEEHIAYHENIWPKVPAGLVAAGLTGLRIYRVPGTDTIVLTLSTAPALDLASATGPGSAYRTLPRCEEWGSLMGAVRTTQEKTLRAFATLLRVVVDILRSRKALSLFCPRPLLSLIGLLRRLGKMRRDSLVRQLAHAGHAVEAGCMMAKHRTYGLLAG